MLKHWVFFDAANQMIPGRFWLDGMKEVLSIYEHAPYGHADNPLLPNANKFDMGVCVAPRLFGWNETLKFYEKVGIKNIERKVRANGDYCNDRLTEIGCKILTPEDKKNRHGIIMYTTGSYDLDSEWTCEKPIKRARGASGAWWASVSATTSSTPRQTSITSSRPRKRC